MNFSVPMMGAGKNKKQKREGREGQLTMTENKGSINNGGQEAL